VDSCAVIIDRIDEEALLFALTPDGHWAAPARKRLHRTLAAAWLAELVTESRLRIVDGRVVPRTKTPIGDPTLDWVMDNIRAAKRPRKAKTWVRRLSRRARSHIPEVMERLQGRGHIDIVGKGRSARYPAHDAQGRTELREYLREVLLGKRGAEDSSLALIAILDGAGLTAHAFGAQYADPAHVDRLLQRDHRFSLLRRILMRRRRAPKPSKPTFHVK
jgi:hypothetical protein